MNISTTTTKEKPSITSTRPIFFNVHEYTIHDYQAVGEEVKRYHEIPLIATHFPSPYSVLNSPEELAVRIVRIPRCFNNNNEYPQFSENLPGLEPGAVSDGDGTFRAEGQQLNQWFGSCSVSPLSNYLTQAEFSEIVQSVNSHLKKAYGHSLWTSVWQLLEFWDVGVLRRIYSGNDKNKLDQLEKWIDVVNGKFLQGGKPVRIIHPKRNGFLSLDFEIPTPSGPVSIFSAVRST